MALIAQLAIKGEFLVDKATVVSVCNFPIDNEYKPQLNPSFFSIKAAEEGSIAILVIESPIEYVPTLDYKSVVRNVPALEVAKSFCRDWIDGQLCTSIATGALPGLFAVDNAFTIDEADEQFPTEISNARSQHTNWANNLVKMADDIWSESPKHRHISDSMRNAAKYLKLERAWAKRFEAAAQIFCPACRTVIDSKAIVCSKCNCIINEEAYDKLRFASR